MRNFSFIVFLFLGLISFSCQQVQDQQNIQDFSKKQLYEWNKGLTNIIVADIFTPPVASRIYAYTNIAAYEALKAGDASYRSFAGQLNGLKDIPSPKPRMEYNYHISSIIAFSTVAKKMVFAGERVEDMENSYLAEVEKTGIDKEVLENSLEFGRQVGSAILDWAKKDGYLERQALSRYVVLLEPGKWQPTAPNFMPAIEPNWHTIRPFVMDSSSQFKPAPPTPFDTVPGSQFYQEVMEVYELVKQQDEEKLEIAKFWDCNPNISYTNGHVMYFDQKISPGGHWISIASIACEARGLDPMESSETLAMVSIALADGFISCWDEKFKSNLIRPETYIEHFIDPDWDPILQTPAFPEYSSGHSVISSAAAVVLTHLLGESFVFADSSEVDYGLPVRHYSSFFQASDEAALSRLYGGIHFRPAVVNGVEQGKQVGKYVVSKIQTHVPQIAGN